jgi:hypothetical protein
MIVIQTHNWVHRLRNDGIMESAPCGHEGRYYQLDWQQRTPDSMDMSGGDFEFIHSNLQRLVDIFRNRIEPIPRSTPVKIEEIAGETAI